MRIVLDTHILVYWLIDSERSPHFSQPDDWSSIFHSYRG